jgi:hypothetical protein
MWAFIKENKSHPIGLFVALFAAILLIVARGGALFQDFICLGVILMLLAYACVNALFCFGPLIKRHWDKRQKATKRDSL